MAITFDSLNKWILLPNVTSITAQEIYNAAMDWADEQEAMDNTPPMHSTGFAPLGGGSYSDKIFILNDGWKLKPYSGTYILTIIGTVITDDGSNRTVPPDSGTVQVIFQVSSQGIIIPGVGEWTQTEKDAIISDVGLIKSKVTKPMIIP